LADILLVDGNPLENIALMENPEKNFVFIMKPNDRHQWAGMCSARLPDDCQIV
jgi:hypothetical protein